MARGKGEGKLGVDGEGGRGEEEGGEIRREGKCVIKVSFFTL